MKDTSYDDAIIIILNLTLLFMWLKLLHNHDDTKEVCESLVRIFFYFIILCLVKIQDLHSAKLDNV